MDISANAAWCLTMLDVWVKANAFIVCCCSLCLVSQPCFNAVSFANSIKSKAALAEMFVRLVVVTVVLLSRLPMSLITMENKKISNQMHYLLPNKINKYSVYISNCRIVYLNSCTLVIKSIYCCATQGREIREHLMFMLGCVV